MKTWKPLIALGAVIFLVACWFVLRGSPMEDKAIDAEFVRTIQPMAEKEIAEKMLAKPGKITWDEEIVHGSDEAASPAVAFLSLAKERQRVLRIGFIEHGGQIVLEGDYKRAERRFTNVSITITFPGKVFKQMGNVMLTPAYLKENGVHPTLAAELMKGLGQGSMEATHSTDYQATAVLHGTKYEATTAVFTGPKSTSLTLTSR